jgi:hypothetical protein
MMDVKPNDKIVMNTTAAGPAGNHISGQTYIVGKHVTLAQAKAYVAGNYAKLVKAVEAVVEKVKEEIETAEAPKPENAAARDAKPGKTGK